MEYINGVSKILVLAWILVTGYKIEFTSWKHFLPIFPLTSAIIIFYKVHPLHKIEFTSWKHCSLVFPLTSAIIIFSKVHGNVMLSDKKYHITTNILHLTFLQCVWTKPNLFSSSNVENLTSNFCQSIQICCREKEKDEINVNCRAFCVILKRKNETVLSKYIFFTDFSKF